MADYISQYKVGQILSLEGCGTCKLQTGKALKACRVDIGEDDPITVVTSASNVREGSRVIVAPIGSSYLDLEGFEQSVQKSIVGGVVSEGMLCDSKMLGWVGGGRGVAAILPNSFEIGSEPPSSKPRPKPESESEDEEHKPPPEPQGLFEKKLTKEERKKLAEERRRARKAAKAAKAKASDNGNNHP